MKKIYLLRCTKIDSDVWFNLNAYFDLDKAIQVKESKEETNDDWLYAIDIVDVC